VSSGSTYTPNIRKDRVYKEGYPRFRNQIIVEKKFYSEVSIVLMPEQVESLLNFTGMESNYDADFPLKNLTDYLKQWSKQNCKGRIMFGSFGYRWAVKLRIDFECKSDLTMFKLVWGNL
jgi:hypothetical protein